VGPRDPGLDRQVAFQGRWIIFTETIGLIPAAGVATRLGRIPGSKEVFPLSWERSPGGGLRPRVACEHLLDAMRHAHIESAYIILRDGKWDIPGYLQSGGAFGVRLAYLMAELLHGVPFSLDAAFSFVKEARVALGFPDILFGPIDAYRTTLARQEETGADVVLGLFPARDPSTCDMVETGGSRVVKIEVKPARSTLRETWGLAVWTPRFTRFLHEYVRAAADSAREEGSLPELFVGDVIQAAIDGGSQVEGIRVSEEPYIDIGTPESLRDAVLRQAGL
jgi:glucose-1-phosphate thymidylyltransferase